MMQLIVNDVCQDVESGLSILQFLEARGQVGNYAIAVNMEFIPRSLYASTILKENDKVDIVQPMQGG